MERIKELGVLKSLSSSFKWTKEHGRIFEDIKNTIAWYNLLFLEEPIDSWKIYWHGLTHHMDMNKLQDVYRRFEMDEKEHTRMLSQREGIERLVKRLILEKPSNYEVYQFLSIYDAETLLYIMAKVKNEKLRKIISNYFTKLKHMKPQLRGKDLIDMGFKPGPIFGKILETVLEAKLNGLVRSKEDEIEFVKERFKGELRR